MGEQPHTRPSQIPKTHNCRDNQDSSGCARHRSRRADRRPITSHGAARTICTSWLCTCWGSNRTIKTLTPLKAITAPHRTNDWQAQVRLFFTSTCRQQGNQYWKLAIIQKWTKKSPRWANINFYRLRNRGKEPQKGPTKEALNEAEHRTKARQSIEQGQIRTKKHDKWMRFALPTSWSNDTDTAKDLFYWNSMNRTTD